MEYNNLATTPGPGWRTTHGLEPLRFVDGRVYYEEGVNSVKVFLPITGGNYKATYFVQDSLNITMIRWIKLTTIVLEQRMELSASTRIRGTW